jgi:molybdopterin/thiamine biosynthesis adenylyltransferase
LALSERQKQLYARHLVLPGIGERGQQALLDARVLLIGAGGLGSPIALYLAAAGVGRLTIVDDDKVELSNLQRQIIHRADELDHPKAQSAARTLANHAPDIEVVPLVERFNDQNASRLVSEADVVVDCVDNFETRYLASKVCVEQGKPFVHGSIYRFEGQATTFAADGQPCYHCLYPEPPSPETIRPGSETGLFGVLPGIIGCIQASETIKLITGFGNPLFGKLLVYDADGQDFRKMKYLAEPDCPVCGDKNK